MTGDNDEVVIERAGRDGAALHIELNRPRALNALTLSPRPRAIRRSLAS
ncbi:MAG: hypothetical protein HY060_08560 [Proteobacteria bacterium]|nr:hypothetical protein [Pseudomonadota bacterium]